MDVTRISENPALAQQTQAATDRAAALAEARKRANAAAQEGASAARERQAEQIAQLRDLIAHVTGADTRLSIQRSEALDHFVYRAIDVDSGEIVQEWPPVQFAEFVNSLMPGAADQLIGLLVDSEA
jgi:uncharacterized FlaG/YvyC family protein